MTTSYSNATSLNSSSSVAPTLNATTAEPRIQNVTKQIEKIHRIYGASDYTSPNRHAAGKSLNYANGASIQRAENETVTVIPYTLKYNDTVGLFGAENHFVRIKANVQGDVLLQCFEEPGWECASVNSRPDEEFGWEPAAIDTTHDQPVEDDGYEQATMSKNKLNRTGGYLSVELINKGTGLHCNDAWLDTRLYTEGREEHAFPKMYIKQSDIFYIGFHARNTRRLGYDVECVIGNEYVQYEDIEDKQLIMSR